MNKENIKNIKAQPGLIIPDEKLFALPERVLQFGTGVLLRGLPDYFIDKANRNGIFNGRVVIVKSTNTGDTDAFDKQDGLFTLLVRGVVNGQPVEETIINSAISRVLSARDDWSSILECAKNPEMQVIVSNTTEVGITLVEDDIRLFPPHSYPGKLLAFLYERFRVLNGSPESGMVIVPTELIPDNGSKLKSIVMELTKMNNLGDAFTQWLQSHNHFCNTLVDRIVPGKITAATQPGMETTWGYEDDLMIMAENFRLWAIESREKRVEEILSFSQADEGIVIEEDIEKFRELKLRLLNGTHTFSCGLAHLAGFITVKEAMSSPLMADYIRSLMMQEIVPVISNGKISTQDARVFAMQVLDRFLNPFLEHAWLNITVQFTSKMKLRNIPLLLAHYKQSNQAPEHMSLGFAAYLLFMKCSRNEKAVYTGMAYETEYNVRDDQAGYFAEKWKNNDPDSLVDEILADKTLWGVDLSSLEGFAHQIKIYLRSLIHNGVMSTFRSLQKTNKVIA
ncbi:MAG TPA: tagaturonate reductase [Chitinophagaceae bacterium]|nr:tagaturonate reductase [Chitinophagaceae bacterium]